VQTLATTSPPQTAQRAPWPIVAVLACAAATAALQQSAVLPLLPRLQRDLHTSVTAVTWVLTVSLLVGAVATPLLSRFGDMYGRRPMVLAALGLLVAGSIVAGLATSLPVLIVARVLQGTSAALVPLAIAVARDVLPRHHLATGIGVLSATMGVGFGGGMILAGLVSGEYRMVFWTTGALAAVVFVFAAVLVRDTAAPARSRPDVPGALLLALTLVSMLLGISEGRSWGWASPGIVALLATAVVAGVAWVIVELRTAEPLVEISMLTHRGTVGATVAGLLLGFGLFASMTALSPFLQTPRSAGYGFGASTLQVGLYLIPTTVLMLAISLFAGRLMRRFPASSMVATGSAFVGLAGLWLLVSHDHELDVYGAATLLGLGIGIAYAALGTMAVEHVDPAKTAVASGINALARVVGGSVSSAVVAAVISANTDGPLPSVRGYEWSFALTVAAAVAAVTFAAIFGIINRRSGRA
jgi:MFS family permease